MANDLAKDLGIKLSYFRNYNDDDPENNIDSDNSDTQGG